MDRANAIIEALHNRNYSLIRDLAPFPWDHFEFKLDNETDELISKYWRSLIIAIMEYRPKDPRKVLELYACYEPIDAFALGELYVYARKYNRLDLMKEIDKHAKSKNINYEGAMPLY